jgi:hypothetical protein
MVAGYADWAVVSPLKLRSKVRHQFIVPCLLCALASKIRQRDDRHNCDHRDNSKAAMHSSTSEQSG